MNKSHLPSKRGPATAVLLAGVLVLATGCVEDRAAYVPQPYPVTVVGSEPLPPPPLAALPAPASDWAPSPPPAPAGWLRSAAELDQMLAPIALYPDPLLAQLLPAATLPEQVVLADRYLREGGDVNQIDAQPWDESLKALARYPATLQMLDENLAWTTDLGQAFINQPTDVMDSVQRLRAQARAVGNLQSTPQQTVLVSEGAIEIVPATPQVIYVPVYQPDIVYVQPPPAPGRFYISFGAGLAVGAWLNYDCDWHAHEVIVWHHDHPRPADWWYHPSNRREPARVVNNVTVVNNTTIVNQNVTVWHPRTRGATADRGDRGWGQANARVPAPTRNEGARAGRTDARPPTVVAQAPAQEARPNQPEAQRSPIRAPKAQANLRRETVKPVPVFPSREIAAAPTPSQAPAPAVAPREASPAKPPMAKAPTLPAAKPSNPQPPFSRELKAAARPNPFAPAPKDVRPAPAPVAPKQSAVVTPSQRPAAQQPASRPVANATGRPSPGALSGIESSQLTRAASARGQQSRETITRPGVTVRPASAPAPSPKANSSALKQPQKGR